MRNPLADDLDAIVKTVSPHWEDLRGRRIFITGGTGFVGTWLLESLVWANQTLSLDAHATVLTRNPSAFRQKAPHLAGHASITLLQGDVTSFRDPSKRSPDFMIHGAAESSTRLNEERPLDMISSIVDGTRRVLGLARERQTSRLLFLSSGAVYGPQPSGIDRIEETYGGAPDLSLPGSAYGEAKRLGEILCHCAARQSAFEIVIARLFAFVGPYLPLDSHFAAGNFIGNALRGETIRIKGDGTTRRTYLYAADLAAWLWTILLAGSPSRSYNVGSERELSILELAHAVRAQFTNALAIDVALPPKPDAVPERYAPSTLRARTDLGLRETVDLHEALKRTIAWHRSRQ